MKHRFRINSRMWPWKYVRLKGKADGWTFGAEPGAKTGAHKILINSSLTGRKLQRTVPHPLRPGLQAQMSTWLIGAVGIVYFVIGCEMLLSGRYALTLVWWGYAVAQVGLWHVSR